MNPMAPERKSVKKDSTEAIMEALNRTFSGFGIRQLELYLMHKPPKSHSITDYMNVMEEAVRHVLFRPSRSDKRQAWEFEMPNRHIR